ncbi:MAG: DNA polymerase [Bacteroidales bacterium]
MKDIIFLDIETKDGEIILIGVMDLLGNYIYFTNGMKFYEFLLENKIKKVYAYNLEFDFFVWYFSVQEQIPKKVRVFTNTLGVVYIQLGNIYFYDLRLHFDQGLRKFGKLVGLEKLEYNYDQMQLNSELLEYNRRDLELTRLMYNKLCEIYNNERDKLHATISSNAMNIFNRFFLGIDYGTIPEVDLDMFQKAYKGGWCEVFMPGKFLGKFYYVDVNSLYPFVMQTEYPYPYEYEKIENVNQLKFDEIKSKISDKYWLAFEIDKDNENIKSYNNVENEYDILLHTKCSILFVFYKTLYPFKRFVEYFSKKKIEAESRNDLFARQIYKRLMNSLYGRFALKPVLVKVIFNCKLSDVIKNNKIISYEEIKKDVFLVKEKRRIDNSVNYIWSIYTTAKARAYMKKMYDIFTSRGVEIFYTDTDSFIVDDVEKIQDYIDDKKIGFFKIEHECTELEIKGKKIYRMDELYKVKGIENEDAKEFFHQGYVEVDRFVKWKTAIRTGMKVGEIYKRTIANVTNDSYDEDYNPLL